MPKISTNDYQNIGDYFSEDKETLIELKNDVDKLIDDALQYIFTDKRGECTIPDDVIKRLAKALLPNILAYFESEEGKKEFETWKQQTKTGDKENIHVPN